MSLCVPSAQFGDKVGVMRCPEFEGSLVFYINQEVIGIMATSVPDKVFAFVEMHDNCEKITITPVHSVSQVHTDGRTLHGL